MDRESKKRKIRSAADAVLSMIYPERCAICDRTVRVSDMGICPQCSLLIKENTGSTCFKCGKPLEDETEEYCRDCVKKTHSFDRGVSLYPYSERMAKSIYRFKYAGRRRYALFYGRRMAEFFGCQIRAWQVDAILPVPLHKKRMRVRGYNQAALVAGVLGERLGIPVREDILERVVNTRPQKLLKAARREDNLKNAFKINRFEVKLNTVLLVDDIYTTGSTIDEISGLLKRVGVKKVFFATVATGRI